MPRRRRQRRPKTSFKKGSTVPRNVYAVPKRVHNRRRLNRLAFAVARLCHGPNAAVVPRPDIRASADCCEAASFSIIIRWYSAGAHVPCAIIKPRCAIVSQAAIANSVIMCGSGCVRRSVRLFMRVNRNPFGGCRLTLGDHPHRCQAYVDPTLREGIRNIALPKVHLAKHRHMGPDYAMESGAIGLPLSSKRTHRHLQFLFWPRPAEPLSQ
jgi:hypothetical protein